jgi:hypothetical protein
MRLMLSMYHHRCLACGGTLLVDYSKVSAVEGYRMFQEWFKKHQDTHQAQLLAGGLVNVSPIPELPVG